MEIKKDDLMVKCKRCNGQGNSSTQPGWYAECPDCDGEGWILTESGKAIKELLLFLKKSKGVLI